MAKSKALDVLEVNPEKIDWTKKYKSASGKMKVSDLEYLHISTYSTHDPDSPAPRNHGYQRDPDKKRFPNIGKHFAHRDNADHITPLIVSIRLSDKDDIKKFERLYAYGDFEDIVSTFPSKHATMSLIDGQHRRGGLLWAHEQESQFNPNVPIQLFFGLTYIEEAEMFDKINSTQKKLPKALIEVTKGDITERDDKTHPQMIRELSFGLARDKDSVWYEKVNMTGARDPNRYVTYEGLRRSTSNMFTAEVVSLISSRGENPLEDYLKVYWKLVSEACSDAWNGELKRTIIDPDTGETEEELIKWRIKELVGVASLARLGQDIIKATIVLKDVKPEKSIMEIMKDYTDKLSEVDWEKSKENIWMSSQAGFAGQSELYGVLHNWVFSNIHPDGE